MTRDTPTPPRGVDVLDPTQAAYDALQDAHLRRVRRVALVAVAVAVVALHLAGVALLRRPPASPSQSPPTIHVAAPPACPAAPACPACAACPACPSPAPRRHR